MRSSSLLCTTAVSYTHLDVYKRQGEHITAGNYDFEIIHIPGHTYGSIALLDRDKRLLLPGDTVQKSGPIFMFGENRNLDLYIESLKKLLGYADWAEVILPSHHGCPVSREYIDVYKRQEIHRPSGWCSHCGER